MSIVIDISGILQDHNRWWSDANYRETRAIMTRRSAFSKLFDYVGDLHEGRALLLVGPRQVGKTTLLLQLADELLDRGWPAGNLTFFDFADERLVEPVSPRDVVATHPPGTTTEAPRIFLLDEIQYAPGWSRWLKSAVDQARRSG